MNPRPDPFVLQDVFQVDDYLYFYAETITDERTDQEVAALVQLLGMQAPMQILDLACGFGRHANRLAAMGHQVTGIDLMEGFLELARQDAARRGVQVDYRQGDMRQLDLGASFDRVLLLFTAFGYFEDDDNLLVLQNIARHLKPGGLFFMDFPNRDMALKDLRPCFVMEKEGNLMIDRVSFDSLTGRMTNRRIVIRDGVRRDKPFTIRYYNPGEISALLRLAGLEVHALYGTWEGQPPSGDSRRLLVVARKPA